MRIDAEGNVNPLSSIAQIEMTRLAKTARSQGSVATLIAAASRHVEFVNYDVAMDICHPHMQRQKRATCSKSSKKETAQWIPPINNVKTSLNQPSDPRYFVVFENSR